jgi:coenzyme F420-reducing hydrogenase delta subunit
VLLFGCRHAAALRRIDLPSVGVIDLECISQLPPSFIDFAISRGLADGVVITGCPPNNCHYRLGNTWTARRIDRERDPRLRTRVPRDRLLVAWAGLAETDRLRRDVQAFSDRLANQPAAANAQPAPAEVQPAGAAR